MADQNRFFTISRKIPHHSTHSGYDLLSRYAGEPVRIPNWLVKIRGLGPVHDYFRKRSGMEWYDGLYAEIMTALHMRKHPDALYHFLFAENAYRYLPALRPKRSHKVIGTFHATPSEFQDVMKSTDHLKSLEGAIIVANHQKEMLASFFDASRIFFVPHGVDTKYFSPSEAKETTSRTCICVGHHHRDFQMLANAARLIRENSKDVRFILVDRVFDVYLPDKQRTVLRKEFASAGIELKASLTDIELMQLYRKSALMILPLREATANVALLEAISCGLPVVTNDIDGVRDYLSPNEAGLAVPGDAESMAELSLKILNDPAERARLSVASRQKALLFDWKCIAEQILRVYHTIASS